MKKLLVIALSFSLYALASFFVLKIIFPCLGTSAIKATVFEVCTATSILNSYLVLLLGGFAVFLMSSFLFLSIRGHKIAILSVLLAVISILAFYIATPIVLQKSTETPVYLDSLLE